MRTGEIRPTCSSALQNWAALARSLADAAVVLMRGHGSVAVGGSVAQAVRRAVFAERNAKAQADAIALGGTITFLTERECEAAAASNDGQIARAWELRRS